MNILIDAFGGDNAPLEVIRGGAQAVQELGVTVTLVGDEQKIRTAPRKTVCRWTAWKFSTPRQCSTSTKNPHRC
mgnify:CR=1 FL=1